MQRLKTSSYLKIFIAILAWSFLGCKMASFQHWGHLNLFDKTITQSTMLILVVLLMPLNVILEAWHWKFSVSGIKKINLHSSLKMVLGSMIPAMITPLKIGEWPGRASFFPLEHRGETTIAAALAGIVKTITLSLWGTLSLLLILLYHENRFGYILQVSGITIVLLLLFVLFISGKTLRRFINRKFLGRFNKGKESLDWLNSGFTVKSIAIASLRTSVFYIQFGLMVLFFIPYTNLSEIIFYIPVYFMILTFLPAFSIADPALRGSVAIVLFSGLVENVPLIGIAGVMLWFINNLLPMISGSVIWFRKPEFSYQVVRKRNSY
ncbi:hypothetical protein ACE01N_11230 [Saccharicrinis sp. FJH2]|uniref:hypothetical protein n=1 Tax=Saccharicrinis sp. FJH65 TaxID=3344659 RepID=UPI0035F2F7AD